MALRFWRRVSLAPGLTLNLSKRGASLSTGPRGAKYTVGTAGRRGTVSLPGTGLFYTVRGSRGKAKTKNTAKQADTARRSEPAAIPASHQLNLGFFKRLTTPRTEVALVEGLKALVQGDNRRALSHFEQAPALVDAHWLAGVLRLKQKDLNEAEAHLKVALKQVDQLGQLLARYEVVPTVSLTITPYVTAHIQPRRRGTLLALAECYELMDQPEQALACLEDLLTDHADDVVVQLAVAETLMERGGHAQRVVSLIGNPDNDSDAHAALLMIKGQALAELGLHDAAIQVFTQASRRRKDRDPDLIRQIRYERALAYEVSGKGTRARQELEALYAEDPELEDVAQRLGLV